MPFNKRDALSEKNLTDLLNYARKNSEFIQKQYNVLLYEPQYVYQKLKKDILPAFENAKDLSPNQKKLLEELFVETANLLIIEAYEKSIEKKQDTRENFAFADRLLNYIDLDYDTVQNKRAYLLGKIRIEMKAEEGAIATLQDLAEKMTSEISSKDTQPSLEQIHAAIATANSNLRSKNPKHKDAAEQAILHNLFAILYYQHHHPITSKKRKGQEDSEEELQGNLNLSKMKAEDIPDLRDQIDPKYFKADKGSNTQLAHLYVELGFAYLNAGKFNEAYGTFDLLTENYKNNDHSDAYVFRAKAMLGKCMVYLNQHPQNLKQASSVLDVFYTAFMIDHDFTDWPSIRSLYEYLHAEIAVASSNYTGALGDLDRSLHYVQFDNDANAPLNLLNKIFDAILTDDPDKRITLHRFYEVTNFKEKLYKLITALDLPLQLKALQACLVEDTQLGSLMWLQRGLTKVTLENKTFTKIKERISFVENEMAKYEKPRAKAPSSALFQQPASNAPDTQPPKPSVKKPK